MIRFSIITVLILQLALFMSPILPATPNVYAYSADEVAGSAREATQMTGDFYSLEMDYKTDGEVDEETLVWCENLIAQTFMVMPEEHVDAVHNLTLSFDPTIRRGLAGGNTLIIRCVDTTEKELVAVLIHELGHVVDTGLLDGSFSEGTTSFDDRGQLVYANDPSAQYYGIAWENNGSFTAPYSGFISGYSTTNPYEDFAETYAAYVLQGPLFRAYAETIPELKAKYEFMRDIVFGGIEFDFDPNDVPTEEEIESRVYDITRADYDLELFLSL